MVFPYQIKKSGEEANLKEVENPDNTWVKCLFCKYLGDTWQCSKGHNVTDPKRQVCDEWRYVA